MGEGIVLNLNGFYNHNGRQNKLDGPIDIMPSGAFMGDVYNHAHGLINPEQYVKGHIIKDKSIARLIFLKFLKGKDITDVLYKLESPITQSQHFSFIRDFKGTWQILPYKIKYNKDYNLFIASIDSSVRFTGDKSEISITE